MKNPDNKKIVQPNSAIMSGAIINITANDTRRVDMTIIVNYTDDLNKVQNIITEILNADSRVLQDPAPQVVVAELADSSVNVNVHP
jgi:small conductance mechanosensitive channel